MISRREFFKRSILYGLGLSMRNDVSGQRSFEIPKPIIECFIENPDFEHTLTEFAYKSGYNIYFEDSFDGTWYVPSNALIIDRNLISKDDWAECVDSCNEYEFDPNFIFIDNLIDLSLPSISNDAYFDISQDQSIQSMKQYLTTLKIRHDITCLFNSVFY